jgi:hypothetical protein
MLYSVVCCSIPYCYHGKTSGREIYNGTVHNNNSEKDKIDTSVSTYAHGNATCFDPFLGHLQANKNYVKYKACLLVLLLSKFLGYLVHVLAYSKFDVVYICR